MTELTLVRPWWLAAIPLGFALVWWLRRRRDRSGSWESIVDPALLPHLIVGVGAPRREWPWGVMAFAVVVAGVALAGPAFERIEQPLFRSLTARVVVLDVSRSMDARDLSPSRMVRARYKVSDLLQRSREGRTGLVVFAGDAFVAAPLTRDTETLVHLLSVLDTSVIPVQGSRPDLGLAAARDLLDQGQAAVGEIILVTDGGQGQRTRDGAQALAARGIRVSLLAIGTREGAPVPLPKGGFLRGLNGVIVVPRVDVEALRAVAVAGKGRFAMVTADNSDVDWLLGAQTDDPWREALEEADQTTDEWRDEGPWLVLLLLPMAALAFRRGWLLAWPLVLSFSAADVDALEFADLWARRDQQTAQAIERGDTDRAAAAAPDHWWRGAALYRGGRYEESADAFAAGDTAGDHYNRGNALARAGDLRGAVDAYREALARDPEYEDAEHNLKLVESIIESQPEGQPGEGEGESEEEGESKGKPGGAGSADQQGAEDGASDQAGSRPGQEMQAAQRGESGGDSEQAAQASEGSSEDGEGEEPEAGAREAGIASPEGAQDDLGAGHLLTGEQRIAYEQWIRSIPDDPGGLLRRKFALEHQGRDREPPTRSDAW